MNLASLCGLRNPSCGMGFSLLEDQQLAGLLMMTVGSMMVSWRRSS